MRVAERRKQATYPELSAAEVGGRWSDGAWAMVRNLVRLPAVRAPPAVRRPASWSLRGYGLCLTRLGG